MMYKDITCRSKKKNTGIAMLTLNKESQGKKCLMTQG